MSSPEQLSTAPEDNLSAEARVALAALEDRKTEMAEEALTNPMYLSETEGKDDKLFAFMNNPLSRLKKDIPKKTA